VVQVLFFPALAGTPEQIDLPQEMQRAIAAQAEAERERRAKVINAEGSCRPPRS
jgi:hypothetical protein